MERSMDPSHFDDDDRILLEEIYLNIKMDDFRIALEFIIAMQNASLDDKGIGLDKDAVKRLRNPPTECVSFNGQEVLKAAIKLYLGLPNMDRDYETARAIHMELEPNLCFPTLYQVKEAIVLLTGVEAVIHDMCINSCIGFTGPFADCKLCTECGEPRWDQDILQESQGTIKSARKQFSTILIGPQLQVMFRDPEAAKQMHYCWEYTEKVFEHLHQNHDTQTKYEDFLDGSDYLNAVTEIPFVDESTKWELLSLLGDWYEPESTESLFSSMPSDAVFFSS